jgi:hypothetical protein
MPGLTRRKSARGVFSKRRKIRVALLGFIAAAIGAIGGLAVWGGLVFGRILRSRDLTASSVRQHLSYTMLCVMLYRYAGRPEVYSSLVLLYSLPSIAYLLLAQTDTPSSVRGIFLPFHPSKCTSVRGPDDSA